MLNSKSENGFGWFVIRFSEKAPGFTVFDQGLYLVEIYNFLFISQSYNIKLFYTL